LLRELRSSLLNPFSQTGNHPPAPVPWLLDVVIDMLGWRQAIPGIGPFHTDSSDLVCTLFQSICSCPGKEQAGSPPCRRWVSSGFPHAYRRIHSSPAGCPHFADRRERQYARASILSSHPDPQRSRLPAPPQENPPPFRNGLPEQPCP